MLCQLIEFPPPPEDIEMHNINSNESTIVDGTCANIQDSDTDSDTVNKPNQWIFAIASEANDQYAFKQEKQNKGRVK